MSYKADILKEPGINALTTRSIFEAENCNGDLISVLVDIYVDDFRYLRSLLDLFFAKPSLQLAKKNA